MTDYHFQIEEGQTATTFTPYSNICPITGYTEVGVEDVGKNEWTLANSYTSSGSGDWVLADTTVLLSAGTYTISIDDATSANVSSFYFKNASNTTLASVDISSNGSRASQTFTISEGVAAVAICMYGSARTISNIQIEKGSIDTPYEPYQSRTASVTFGQTVYGGSVDLTTGVLTVDSASVDLGSLEWYSSIENSFSAEITNLSLNQNALCDRYIIIKDYNVWVAKDDAIWPSDVQGAIYVRDSSYNDAATFKTAMNGVQFVYELAEPFTIQLTPQELKLLQDTNNLTTNGTTITIDYIPNNSIGDAVKASEEYTDRAVEAKGGVQKTVIFDDLVRIADEITLSLPSSYNFIVFEVNYMYDGATGSAIYSSLIDSINIPANYSGTSHWMELRRAGDIVSVRGDTDIDQGGALLKITAF